MSNVVAEIAQASEPALHEDSNTQGAPENLFEDMGVNEDYEEAGGDADDDDDTTTTPDEDDEDLLELDEDEGKKEDEEKDDEDEDEDEDEGEDKSKSSKAVDGIPDDAEVTVTVDGEETKVTFKEMREGYIRTDTFHRRLNTLHEAKEVITREAGLVAQRRDESIGMLEALQNTLKQLVPTEPDWDKEFAANPANARALQKQYQDYKGQLQMAQEAHNKLLQERDAETTESLQTFAKQESEKIPRVFPQWNDAKVRTRDISSMKKTAEAAGFSQEEYESILDTRMLVVLHKAATLDRMQARRAQQGKAPQQGKGKTGVGSSRTAPTSRSSAAQRLARTGSVEAAGDVFASIIERGSKRG